MTKNFPATLLLSVTLGVALAFMAVVGAIVVLPKPFVATGSGPDLASVSQLDIDNGAVLSLSEAPLADAIPTPPLAPVDAAVAPVVAPAVANDSVDGASTTVPAAATEQSPSVPTQDDVTSAPDILSAGEALLTQVSHIDGPTLQAAAGAFVASQIPLLSSH